MMNRNTDPVSGRASALRVDRAAPLMTIFKTRSKPCRIAVRADIKKSRHSKEQRPCFAAICTSLSTDLSRILPLAAVLARFTAHCRRKTDDSQRSCGLLFPSSTGRSNSYGLLEQMPRLRIDELRLGCFLPPQAHSARPHSLLRAIRTHSRSQSLISSATHVANDLPHVCTLL